jgi:hypothetical protein
VQRADRVADLRRGQVRNAGAVSELFGAVLEVDVTDLMAEDELKFLVGPNEIEHGGVEIDVSARERKGVQVVRFRLQDGEGVFDLRS